MIILVLTNKKRSYSLKLEFNLVIITIIDFNIQLIKYSLFTFYYFMDGLNDDCIFNYIYKRERNKDSKKSYKRILGIFLILKQENEKIISYFRELTEIDTKLDKIKYLNWSEDGKYITFSAEYGYYDIIDVSKRRSVYDEALFNGLRHIHDIQFLQGVENAKMIFSDTESIKIFDVNFPHQQYNIVSDVMIGHNKIILNTHDPNIFVFQFSDNRFAHFDIREKYNMNWLYYPLLANISEPVHHCAISPIKPNELAICHMYRAIAFYDFRMLAVGIANSIPSKGLIGIIDPFYDISRPIVTSLDYSADGSEIIVSDYNGFTKIISCNPSLSNAVESSVNFRSSHYSRTFYSDAYNILDVNENAFM
ncbi:hypothetical protein HZS_2624, partial [Henneguya salminicola]